MNLVGALKLEATLQVASSIQARTILLFPGFFLDSFLEAHKLFFMMFNL